MEIKTYVVIDEYDRRLAIGKFSSPEKAREHVKDAEDYNPRARIFVYEIIKEYEFEPEREKG